MTRIKPRGAYVPVTVIQDAPLPVTLFAVIGFGAAGRPTVRSVRGAGYGRHSTHHRHVPLDRTPFDGDSVVAGRRIRPGLNQPYGRRRIDGPAASRRR